MSQTVDTAPLVSEGAPQTKSAGTWRTRLLHTTYKLIARVFCSAKKEAKRLEKEAKVAAKTAKVVPAGEKKAKAEKAKKEEEPEFVNTTPKGEKKGMFRRTAKGGCC
jgi:hypothetical protein